MSPEQATGDEIGPATDVYSLALSLYELWAGYNPVVASTPAATARRIGSELPSLGDVRPELPPALHATIDAALAPEPVDRPGLPELGAALAELAGGLHPDRPVPEPLGVEEEDCGGPAPARPFAVLFAAAALGTIGLLAGQGGLALVLALLLAPAALFLGRPREWIEPALAPLLGLVGLAPLYLVQAARHERPAARVALAALAWAWTVVAATVFGQALGVSDPAGSTAGWTQSAAAALSGPLAPLAGADAVSTALIWVGAAVVLGLILDVAGPAPLAIGGLVWAAGLIAALGAVGGAAGPSPLLTPALLGAVALLAWDRAGRPWPSQGPVALRRGATAASAAPVATVRRRAALPPMLGDERARATRAASRHVRAALHGAGSRGGLP